MSLTMPAAAVEPTPRRIRVRLGNVVVADSRRALLLIEQPAPAPADLLLPRDDVVSDALVDGHPGVGGAPTWAVVAGRSRADDAAWTHSDPTGNLSALADHVTFSWQRLEWFEEDERVVVHARDPHHRVDAIRASRVVAVHADGELLARSLRPVLLFETSLPTRFYLPFGDVRSEFFEPSDLVTICPHKGPARYWSVRVGNTPCSDLAWQYPDPHPGEPEDQGPALLLQRACRPSPSTARSLRAPTPCGRSRRVARSTAQS